MTLDRRQFIQGSAAALAFGAASVPAAAQVIEATKVVVGFAAGGTIDLVGRRLADKLQPGFARVAIVENKSGAGGQIAAQAVKMAAPDGSTLLITPTSPLSLHQYTYRKLPYDPATDFTPVSGAASFDYALAVGPMVPASVKSLPDFIAWCKAHPDEANFGSAGQGSAAHFIGGAIGRLGQADLRHVAFRGTPPAVAGMIGGQIAAVVGPTGEFMSHVKAGKVRLLATSGPRRGRFTPEVPTIAEQGLKDLAYIGWYGIFLPPKASAEVVQRLNAGIRTALGAPDMVESLAAAYMEPMHTPAPQLAAMLKAENEFWAGLVKVVGFTPA